MRNSKTYRKRCINNDCDTIIGVVDQRIVQCARCVRVRGNMANRSRGVAVWGN